MADKIVYSSDPSFCAACQSSPCRCDEPPKPGKARQPYPARLEFRRGSKGSGVTRLDRLIMSPSGKEELLKRLKSRLGCGGTVKEGVLEIQGDQRDFIEAELKKEGYKVQRIGGFTITEVVVVCLVIGVLVVVGVPQYIKTTENSRAAGAVSELQMLAAANRMFAIDNKGMYTNGTFINDCPSFACNPSIPGVAPAPPGTSHHCNLLACKYTASRHLWLKYKWEFGAADGNTQAGGAVGPCIGNWPVDYYVACAIRAPGGPAYSANWAYAVNKSGEILPSVGTTTPPPGH